MVCELFQCYLEKESKDHRIECADEQKKTVNRLLSYDVDNKNGNGIDKCKDQCKSGYDKQVTGKIHE